MNKAKAFAGIALALAIGAVSFNASSSRAYMEVVNYYGPDGGLVGQETVPCAGPVHFWGVRTDNFDIQQTRCFGTCNPPLEEC